VQRNRRLCAPPTLKDSCHFLMPLLNKNP
jgi:hypothetical protein